MFKVGDRVILIQEVKAGYTGYVWTISDILPDGLYKIVCGADFKLVTSDEMKKVKTVPA